MFVCVICVLFNLLFHISGEEGFRVVVERHEVFLRHLSRIGGVEMVFAFAGVAPYQYVADGVLSDDGHQRLRPPRGVGDGLESGFGDGDGFIVRLAYLGSNW